MITTSYGYRKPEQGDLAKGVLGWFSALTFNIDRYNAHDHDGVDSPLLAMSSLSPYTNAIAAASWVADGAIYKQTVTVPAAVTEINQYNVKFIHTAPAGEVGKIALLGYKRLSATTYEVYCNDVTAAFTALYR